MAITGVTRRSLFADLRNSGWWGDCADEVEFLSSLYDLTDLPSTDGRYANAREDLVQHRVSNSDWDDLDLFADARFKLSAAGDDEPLLRFLARTVHPEVVVSVDEVAARVVAYNGHLRPDGWELYQVDRISGRPVYGWRTVRPPTIGLEHIRASIANAIAEGFKSYQVAEFCTDVVGLPPPKDGLEDPHSSKRGYVRRRIDMKNRGELLDIADRVLTLVEDPDLSEVVDAVRAAGDKPSRLGPVKQLISRRTDRSRRLSSATRFTTTSESSKTRSSASSTQSPSATRASAGVSLSVGGRWVLTPASVTPLSSFTLVC